MEESSVSADSEKLHKRKWYIFTDVDGVLNNAHAKGIREGFAWIDDENIHVFSEFVRWCYAEHGKENVILVLISSWRSNNFHGNSCMRTVLDKRLAERENLYFDDETECLDTWSRGFEIANYLVKHMTEVQGYIILDDILWEDFKPLGLSSHWVQTSDDPRNGRGGLRQRHMKKMKEIIGKTVTEKEFVRMLAHNLQARVKFL